MGQLQQKHKLNHHQNNIKQGCNELNRECSVSSSLMNNLWVFKCVTWLFKSADSAGW